MQRITVMAYCVVACLMTIVFLNNYDPWRPTSTETQQPLPIQIPDGSYTPWQEPVSTPSMRFDYAQASITKQDLKAMVYYLASPQLQGRLAGSPGCQAAADYIEKTLKSAGLKTMRDPFRWNSVTTENIYGWMEGTELPDQVVILGAHYDHIGRQSPGADDNASGTSEVLEMARAFAKLGQVRRTVVFQLYSAEEYGLWGSNHYCRNPKFPTNAPNLNKTVLMMNIDMVGYLGRKTSPHRAQAGPTPIDSIIQPLAVKYPFANQVTFRGGGITGESDHASFYHYSQGKIPLVWLFTGTHDNYHRPADTPDKLNYDGMEQIGRYAFELLYNVVQSKSKVPVPAIK